MPRGPRRRLLPVAAFACAALSLGASPQHPASPWSEIAIAEDERRWPDGVLAGYLRDRDPRVRARAALAVGRLQDSSSVTALLPLCVDPDAGVRREAVFALGQIGHRSAGDSLAARLQDRDPETVDLAIEALGKLADKRWTPRVAALLTDPSPRLRGEAAVALWRLADSTALDALVAAAAERDPEVRWRVLYALEKMPPSDRLARVVATGLGDPSARVRQYAARCLGRLKARGSVAFLVGRLTDSDVDVIVNAARALQAIGDTLACAPLAQALSHPHPYVRVTAAVALGELRCAASIPALSAHLTDPDAATRGQSARALLHVAGANAVPQVAAVLADSSVYARAAALEGLRFVPPAQGAQRLRAGLLPGRHLLERITCAETLGQLGAREALADLRGGLRDAQSPFAAACAEAIAALKDSISLGAITEAYIAHLGDADADARQSLTGAMTSLAGKSYADSVRGAHPAPSTAPARYPADFADPSPVRGAVLTTTAGEIEWAFYGQEATQTVKNFVRLARQGYFDGDVFHRVVPAFVIQDGDTSGTGWGGPGYTIRCEYNRLRYDAGMVGMALSGKDTGGSQYFMTHTPQMHLNGRYTIFAHVVRGMDVVARTVQGDRVLKVRLIGG